MADVSNEPTNGDTAAGATGQVSDPTAILDYQTPQEKTWTAGTLTYNKRGLVRLFSWLLWGDLALSIRERSLGEVINAFLKVFGATNTLSAFLRTTLPTILGLALNPTISYMSDRHRGPRGRRRPYLLVGVPLSAACIVGMAASPALGHALHPSIAHLWKTMTAGAWEPNWSILLVFGVFFAIFDVVSTIANSVFGAFFNDVVPRDLLGRFWGLARAVSIAVVIVFSGALLGLADRYYSYMFAAVGLFYGLGFLSTVIMVKEGEYPPVDNSAKKHHSVFANLWHAIADYARECFTKPFYLWVFAAQLLTNVLAFACIYTWAQWFARSVGLTLAQYGQLTALYFILSLPLTPLIGWLADKIHPLRVVIVVLALHIPAAILGGIFIHDGFTFSIAYVVTGLLQVLWGTATAALWPLLYPKGSYAQLSSAAGIIASLIALTFGLGLGVFLDYTHSNYNYTFLLAGCFDILGLLATIVVYRKFIALGGMKGYVAP